MPRYNGSLTRNEKKIISKNSELFSLSPDFGTIFFKRSHMPFFTLRKLKLAESYISAIHKIFSENSSVYQKLKNDFEKELKENEETKSQNFLYVLNDFYNKNNHRAELIKQTLTESNLTSKEKDIIEYCRKIVSELSKQSKNAYITKKYFYSGSKNIMTLTTEDGYGPYFSSGIREILTLFCYHPDNLKILYNDPDISKIESLIRESMLVAPKLLTTEQLIEQDNKAVLFWNLTDYAPKFVFFNLASEERSKILNDYNLEPEKVKFLDANSTNLYSTEELSNLLGDYTIHKFINPEEFICRNSIEELSFLNGKLHPYYLFLFLSSEEFVKCTLNLDKKRKFDIGDSVYVRSSITGHDMISSRNLNYNMIKSLTYKKLLPAIILDNTFIQTYERPLFDAMEIPAYRIQILDPMETLEAVAETALNHLGKKRFFKEKGEEETKEETSEE